MNFKSLLLVLPVAFGLAACGSSYSERDAAADYLSDRGESLEDAALTSKVASMITADRTLSGSEIHVRTFSNTVRLTGYVVSRGDAIRAEDLAYSVSGVRDVDNALLIRP